MLVTLRGQRVNQSCCADIVSLFVILSLFFFQFPYIPYALRGVHMIITIKGCILLQFFFGIFSNHSQPSFPSHVRRALQCEADWRIPLLRFVYTDATP